MGRPAETVTEAYVGIGANENYWWVGVSNFETHWVAGESLKVEIATTDEELQGTAVIGLSTAGSDNGGTIQLTKALNNASTSLDKLSHEFIVLPNYPNLFYSETKVSYGLSNLRNINSKIYNVSGHLIWTLVDGKM